MTSEHQREALAIRIQRRPVAARASYPWMTFQGRLVSDWTDEAQAFAALAHIEAQDKRIAEIEAELLKLADACMKVAE